jgi:hypothetical protein
MRAGVAAFGLGLLGAATSVVGLEDRAEVRIRSGRVEVDVVFGDKRAALRWASRESFELRVSPVDGPSTLCTTLSAEDGRRLLSLAALWREAPPSPLGLYVLGTLNVLVHWPDGMPVGLARERDALSLVLPDGQVLVSRLEPPTDLAPGAGVNICDRLGLPQPARYARAVQFPFTPAGFVETVRVVGSGGCLGRCGRGCQGDGFPEGFDIYTQACLNHDACTEDLGLLALPCGFLLPDVVADTLLFFLFPCPAPGP